MGFTTQQSPILIGLGVSAISDFGIFMSRIKSHSLNIWNKQQMVLLNFLK